MKRWFLFPPYLDVISCAISFWTDGRYSCFHRSCCSVMHEGLTGGQEFITGVYWVVLLCTWWPHSPVCALALWQCLNLARFWLQEKFCLLQVKCSEKQTPNVATGRRKIWVCVQAVCCCLCFVLQSHQRSSLWIQGFLLPGIVQPQKGLVAALTTLLGR